MTGILNEIKTLDLRLEKGDLTPAEYATARAALLRDVEDAQTEFEPAPPRQRAARAKARTGSSALGFSIVVCLAVMGLCIGLTLLFLPNLNLALTLGVTILAALCVALLQEKEEE